MLRLASLLWRLCRATTMEAGLFEIQADHLNGFRQARQGNAPASSSSSNDLEIGSHYPSSGELPELV